MTKKINRMDIILCLLSFFIPVAVFLTIMYKLGFYPFGDKTLFIMDMKGQYLEFYASLRNIISSDDSIFFSWSRSMGGNYLGLFAYYLASPLSFITLFFSVKNLAAGILVLTLLKLGLCGTSFSVLANYLCKKHCNAPKKSHFFVILLFCVSYALLSYNMVYSLCPMWLDGVIFLPLVILGTEKILDGKKGFFYIIVLAALFICNYYTGYMTGIFTAMYFIYRIICELSKETLRQSIKKTLHFTISSMLAILLSAPLIIPVLKDLMEGKLAANSYMPDNATNFEKLSDLFGKFTNGVYDSITNSGLPAIYCGYLALILAIAFFILNGIKVREKIGAALLIGIFWLSFYYVKLDIAWHGFQYPTWFPYRYAFLFSFIILYMAIRTVCAISAIKKINYSKNIRYVGYIVLTMLVAVNIYDMGRNGTALITGLDGEFAYGTLEEYQTFLDKTEPLVENIQSTDSGFYRINQGYEYSKNDSMLLGYNGMTHYSSTFNSAINTLTPKLGIAQTHIWNSGYGSNQMLDSLFAVKYILADRSVPASYTKLKDTVHGSASYANNTALSIAYSAKVLNLEPDLDTGNVYTNQNNFINAITNGTSNYYTELDFQTNGQDQNWYITFTANSDNPVYLYMSSPEAYWANVYVNENFIGNYFTSETKCSLYIGSFTQSEIVTVRVESNQAFSLDQVSIAELSTDMLSKDLIALQENSMNIEKHKAGKLYGTINVKEGEKIMTSIPYSKGWTVKIDGKKITPQPFAGTFMVLETSSGQHEISFTYISPGFTTGIVIFIIALILCVCYLRNYQQLI